MSVTINHQYMVQVKCFTFNHAAYIEDAMNGFCMQKTTFPFVCAIVDDASTDREPEIIKNYLQQHFDLDDKTFFRKEETDDYVLTLARHKTNKNCYFAVFFLKYNHYQIRKPKAPYPNKLINSKYLAICEGDDYWTDPQKLQKQVDFMNSHPKYSMCYHAVNHLSDSKIIGNDKKHEEECDVTAENIIEGGGGYCATCSLLYKSEYVYDIPNFRRLAKVGDAPLQVLLAIRGKVRYFPTIMGTYRKNVPGSWTSRVWNVELSGPYKNGIEWLLEFNKETNSKYEKSVLKRIYPYILYLFNNHIINKKEKRNILNHFSIKTIYKVIGKRAFVHHILSTIKELP